MSTDWSDYSAPIKVEGGLKARSARGAIGETWWSRRFIDVMESLVVGGRLTRGRSYARKGQVLSLDITAGAVRAQVQGSRPKPYAVVIGLAPFSELVWAKVEVALSEQALFSAKLLSGEMPPGLDEVFASAGAPLFPQALGDLTMKCSCPDYAVPCKHLAATFYLLAEAFDADPFQILAWRGRGRDDLLARLRKLRSGGAGDSDGVADAEASRRVRASGGARASGTRTSGTRASGTRTSGPSGKRSRARREPDGPTVGAGLALADLVSAPLDEVVDRFWQAPVPLPTQPPVIETDRDLLLRQLPSPSPLIGGQELVDRLRSAYALLPSS